MLAMGILDFLEEGIGLTFVAIPLQRKLCFAWTIIWLVGGCGWTISHMFLSLVCCGGSNTRRGDVGRHFG